MKNTQTKWVNGVDSIRFFLALIVFLSHIPNIYADTLRTSASGVLRLLGVVITPAFSGTSAVIAFFIISGFVIHYPNKNIKLDVKKFLIRRWLRIGIPLLVVGWVASLYDSFELIPVWSLYCELIYYTIYPLLRKIGISWKRLFMYSFVLSYIVIAIMSPGTFLSLLKQEDVGYLGQYWNLGTGLTWLIGLPCWLLGVMLAEEFDTLRTSFSTWKIWALRFFVFGCSIVTNVVRFKFFASWLITENIFALLLFFWLKHELAYYKQHSSSSFFERLGKFSYSLYLGHALFVLVIMQFIPLNVYTYPVYLILVVCFSYVVYLMVEYPSHRFAQLLTKKKEVKPTSGTH